MNRQEQIGPAVIGGADALDEALPRLAVRDQQAGCGKAFQLELRRDQPREPEIETEFRIVARAQRAIGIWRVANVDDDAEFRRFASGR